MSWPRLWHYVCEHTHKVLGGRGDLVAPPYPAGGVADMYGEAFAWFDRYDRPVWLTTGDFASTGIELRPDMCDRSAFRYLVNAARAGRAVANERVPLDGTTATTARPRALGRPGAMVDRERPIPARLA